MIRFAFYGRVSDEELQNPHLSFPTQKRACEDRIKGIGEVVCEFYDSASGRSEDRPGMTELREESARPDRRFDAVIIYQSSRLARDTLLALQIERDLSEFGIPIYASDESGDPAQRSSRLLRHMKAVLDQDEVEQTIERAIAGMKENVRQGYHNGGRPPYGYRLVHLTHPDAARAAKGKKKVVLEVDSEKAANFRKIVTDRLNGKGYGTIVSELNRSGIPGPEGRPWVTSTVYSMVRNPNYLGARVWNRFKNRRRRGPKENPAEEWVTSEIEHPALMTEAEFHALQNMVRPKRSTNRTRYLLAGFVFCETCGRRLEGKTRKNKKGEVRYYFCAAPKKNPKVEKHSCYVNAEKLEAAILEAIAVQIFDPKNLSKLEANLRTSQSKRLKAQQTQASRIERKIVAREKKIRAIAEVIPEAKEGRGELLKTIDALAAEKEKLIRDREKILRDFGRQGGAAAAVAAILPDADHSKEILASGSFEDKRELLLIIVDRIIIGVLMESVVLELKLPTRKPPGRKRKIGGYLVSAGGVLDNPRLKLTLPVRLAV